MGVRLQLRVHRVQRVVITLSGLKRNKVLGRLVGRSGAMGPDLRAGIPPRVRIYVDQEIGVHCSRGTVEGNTCSVRLRQLKKGILMLKLVQLLIIFNQINMPVRVPHM